MSEKQKPRETPSKVLKAAGEIMRRLHRNEGELSQRERDEVLKDLTPEQRGLLEKGEENQ